MSDLFLDGTASSASGRRLTNRLRRRAAQLTVVALIAALAQVAWTAPAHASAGSSCGANVNPIACENSQARHARVRVGTIDDAGDSTLQGFSHRHQRQRRRHRSASRSRRRSAYTIDIYRLGYYSGNGARYGRATLPITVPRPTQPPA